MTSIPPEKTSHAAENTLIHLENATFRLDSRSVFENTDWEIARGEHWALLGPNGGGKTTLARALCRELPLISGKIAYFFEPPSGSTAARSRSYPVRNEIVRLSPDTPQSLFGQFGGFHQARWQSFTSADAPLVAELLETAAAAFDTEHKPDLQSAASGWESEIISRFDIESLLKKRVVQLSNGEARKVAVARALLLRPKLLILDDPFCGLDRSARGRLRSIIDGLIAAGLSQILLIAHRRDEIPKAITRILHINHLRIQEQGAHAPEIFDFKRNSAASCPETIRRNTSSVPDCPVPETRRTAPPVIDMQDVTISYDGTRILDRIHWRMHAGEHWALLGPNGAGKSTLLSLILADNPQAYANRIFLFGTRRGSGESIWDIKQRIGWVSSELQSYYPGRPTCFEVICSGFYDTVGLYRQCNAQQQSIACAQMAALDISNLRDRRLSDVSTGEKRLVLLARALVKTPQLLIMDEPCQGLDAFFRKRFLALIDSICSKGGISMIYVTHHMDELPASITHKMTLNRGKILTCGKVPER